MIGTILEDAVAAREVTVSAWRCLQCGETVDPEFWRIEKTVLNPVI
jgi:hypothetical protein